jgi:hypothetical protein
MHHRGPLSVLCVLLLIPLLSQAMPARAGGGVINNLQSIRPLAMTGSPLLDQAQRVALAVLASDYTGDVHVASRQYYDRPWLRDSFAWGAVPSLAGGSLAAYAGTELTYWLWRQQSFGGWLTAPQSGYFDETAIMIRAVLDEYEVSGDKAAALGALGRLERGWHWLAHSYIRQARGSGYLLYANVPPHVAADWVDQVARHGYTTQLEALWYGATQALAVLEALGGDQIKAHYYSAFANGIKLDINRMLWINEAPVAVNAPAVPAFGHYRSWQGGRDYFELDSNYLCIVYGIATPVQAGSINHFVVKHAGYLLALSTPDGVPAKVVYGDYAAADYAAHHARIGAGLYQNAYWPSVGALVAIGMTLIGDLADARQIMIRLAAALVRDQDIREWYVEDGTGLGATAFAWAARMFLLALYESYLGIEPGLPDATGDAGWVLRLVRPAGAGTATLNYDGHAVLLTVQGSGDQASIQTPAVQLHTADIPVSLLCSGCAIHATWTD